MRARLNWSGAPNRRPARLHIDAPPAGSRLRRPHDPMNDQHRDSDEAGLPALLAGRYRIIRPLGSGGMADVYLAEDERLGRPVAVKVLKARLAADEEFLERFRIEAQAAARLSHPGIVAVYDRGSADGVTYISMEYVRGESLKQRVRRSGALPPGEAVTTALAVLSALGAAHARAIVHRDVTSHNVMLADDGRVVVTDFGIARMGDSALTRTGAMMGTSSYLSPEQAQGRPADERSDLYGLGVVLYEMLTGRVPFRGETDVAVAMQHISAAPANPRTLSAGIPEALAAAVMRVLSKDPADRYQSAEEFAAALRATTRRPTQRHGETAVSVGEGVAHGTFAAAGVAGAGVATAGVATAGATAAGVAAVFTAPFVAGPTATAVAAEAPTRYRAGEPPPDARPRRRRLRAALLTLLVAAVAASAAWLAYAVWLAPGATVPTVVGDRRSDAAQAVRKEGLKPAIHYVWADRYAAGEVARQSPRGGAAVDDGVKVDLWVSRGPLHLPAPDLSGISAGSARGKLEEAVLTYRSHRAASETTPKGLVFRQRPAAGETVRRGDTVSFWVSSGPPKITVPDVAGLSLGDAQAVLEDAGFTVSTDYVAGWGELPGTVVGQDPVAGTRGRTGDEVVIQVAVF